MDAVGRPVVHVSAMKQATGEAVYIDDMPLQEGTQRDNCTAHYSYVSFPFPVTLLTMFCLGELYLALVLSTKAHATIKSVDWSKALAMPGVVDKVDHTDVPGTNNIDPFEEAFVSKTVGHEFKSKIQFPHQHQFELAECHEHKF